MPDGGADGRAPPSGTLLCTHAGGTTQIGWSQQAVAAPRSRRCPWERPAGRASAAVGCRAADQRELDDRVRRVGTGRLTPTPSTWRTAAPARPGGGKVPVHRRAPPGLGGCLRAGRTSVDDLLGTEPGAARPLEGLAAVLDGRPRQTLGRRASSETLHHLLPPASARASRRLDGRRRPRRPRRSRFGHDGDGRSGNRSPPSAGRFTSSTASPRGRTLPSCTRTLHAGQTSLINLTYSTTGFSSPACFGSTPGRRKFRPRLGLWIGQTPSNVLSRLVGPAVAGGAETMVAKARKWAALRSQQQRGRRPAGPNHDAVEASAMTPRPCRTLGDQVDLHADPTPVSQDPGRQIPYLIARPCTESIALRDQSSSSRDPAPSGIRRWRSTHTPAFVHSEKRR